MAQLSIFLHEQVLTWALCFSCGPLHALSVREGGHIAVTLHTAVLVAAPHAGGRGAVLTVLERVAGRLTGQLSRGGRGGT